jgi:DNA polymerase III subunit alpha
MSMAASFTHLHTHSHYSLLNALPKIKELVAAAKAQGAESLALTDRDNLYGAIEFIKECHAAGLKPIVGLDAQVAQGERIVLLAENEEGYKNLLKIVTDSHLNLSDGIPLATPAMLERYKSGVIAFTPRASESQKKEYARIFAKNFYENVAAQEIYYLKPEDRRAWETMRLIENKGTNLGSVGLDDEEYFMPSVSEMLARYKNNPEALKATEEIAARCNLELKLGNWVFPDFPIPKGSTYDSELKRLIEEGVRERGLDTPEVRARIDYEFGIITAKGYSPYFLVVADLLAFARRSGILTTIRGSVAGSMVTYVTGITNVNPLEYKLPFERFLNPERPSAPDIDMDYADNRRDEVIDYARQKYGEDHVAQIGTFGTMLARGVVRDVARALGYPYGLGDRIAKEIPFGSQGFPMTLDRALAESPELAKIYKEDEEAKEVIDLGKIIEGCARHISVHAAGIVIAPRPLVEFVPLQKDPKGGKIITQYDMHGVEDAGLLKFDFLGIRNLSILAHSVALVKKTRGVEIDIENVPLDDQKTFDMLARGETEGTFQLNGAGMTRYLKELKPTSIHDINAMVALFRPGPMETIPQYIERKHHPELIHYLDPRMKEFLDFSYGVLVYQDDVLLTAIKLAGYSWLEADKLRKAMGKKIPEVMAAEKEKLIKGFVEYGKLTPKLADQLWKLIEPFAAYGFNKAHAASYGKVAYQTAYMKANFPVEYMASILTAEAGDIDTVSIMVAECKRMKIPVLPPDVNESFGDFTVVREGPQADPVAEPVDVRGSAAGLAVDGAIRFGLYSIKNFGTGVADTIIAERKRGGRFVSISDFLRRIKDQTLNKKALESLIECGALDSLGERGQLLASIELLLEYHRETTREQAADSLFSSLGVEESDLKIPDAPAADLKTRLAWEKELLGLYVSGHPLDRFREQLDKRPMTIREMKEKVPAGTENVVAAGMLESVRTILTQKGDQMAFIKIADYDGAIEAVVFPKNFVEYKKILVPETVIALRGKLSSRNGELSMVAEKLKAL